jgi:hypothetical protein
MDYDTIINKSKEYGQFIGNFVHKFDFSIVDSKHCHKFVDDLGMGIEFVLSSDLIEDVMTNKVNYDFCTKDDILRLTNICFEVKYGYYQRLDDKTTIIKDFINAFIEGFKETNSEYSNVVINYDNSYRFTPNNNKLYPSCDIEIKLYNYYYDN